MIEEMKLKLYERAVQAKQQATDIVTKLGEHGKKIANFLFEQSSRSVDCKNKKF